MRLTSGKTKVTQTNTANAEESASAAKELSGQAKRLREMVGQFVLNTSGLAARYPLQKIDNLKEPAANNGNGSGLNLPNGRKKKTSEIVPDDEDFGVF